MILRALYLGLQLARNSLICIKEAISWLGLCKLSMIHHIELMADFLKRA